MPVEPVDGVPLVPGVVGTPPTVFADGGACGKPGLERLSPGLFVPVTVLDGVPRFDSVPLVDGVTLFGGMTGGAGVVVDVDVDGEYCEMAGLRWCGTSGGVVAAGCVGLGRTRSPSGIPWTSARSLGGRGTANTKSDAAASAAR